MASVDTLEWCTPSQAARELERSVSRVRQLAEAGKLRYQTTPYGKLIATEDVRRLVAERAERANG
jgi:hypothetical protein